MTKKLPTDHEIEESEKGEKRIGDASTAGPMKDEDHRLRVRAVTQAQLDLVKALCRLIAEGWRESHPRVSSGSQVKHES